MAAITQQSFGLWSRRHGSFAGKVTILVSLSPFAVANALNAPTVTLENNVLLNSEVVESTVVAPQISTALRVDVAPLVAQSLIQSMTIQVANTIPLDPVVVESVLVAPVASVDTNVTLPVIAVESTVVAQSFTTAIVAAMPALAVDSTLLGFAVSYGNVVTLPILGTEALLVIPSLAYGQIVSLDPMEVDASVTDLTVSATWAVDVSPFTVVSTPVAPSIIVENVIALPALVASNTIMTLVMEGGISPIPPPGDSGEWFENKVWLTSRNYEVPTWLSSRIWESDMAGGITKEKERRYMTTLESKTFGFSVEKEGAIRSGDTIDPDNPGEIHFDPDGPVPGDIEVVDSTFYDSDGRKIRAGKGVKCRIVPDEAAIGVYDVALRINTVGGEVLEVNGELEITETLP